MEERPRFKIICDELNNSEEDRKNGVIHVEVSEKDD